LDCLKKRLCVAKIDFGIKCSAIFFTLVFLILVFLVFFHLSVFDFGVFYKIKKKTNIKNNKNRAIALRCKKQTSNLILTASPVRNSTCGG